MGVTPLTPFGVIATVHLLMHMKAQSPLQQKYFVSQRFVQVVRPWGKRPGTLSTIWFLHTMTGGFERGGGLSNGALVSFDYRQGAQGRGVTLSASGRQARLTFFPSP